MPKKKKERAPTKKETRQPDDRRPSENGWSGKYLDLAARALALDDKKKKRNGGDNAA